jgi:Ca2+-binding RTX toxin-like protein
MSVTNISNNTNNDFEPALSANQVVYKSDNSASVSIVFIDSGVEHIESLIDGVVKDAQVVVLDKSRDGVKQISEQLATRDNIGTVHIISHGAPGCLYLGNSQLSLDTLEQYAPQLQKCFTNANSLYLYGCNVAAGDAGAEFIQKLHQLTGAEIAASAQRTGSTRKGGNWELEVRTGDFVPSLAFLPQVMATYAGVFSSTFTALANAPGDGGVYIQLDSYGSFGYGPFGVSSLYDPVGSLGAGSTTSQNAVAIRFGNTGGRTFLSSGNIEGSGNLPSVLFSSINPTSAQSNFTFNGLNFALDQQVSDLFEPSNLTTRTGSQLTQTYTITNPGSTAVNFELIRYLDGDLGFDGSINDTGGLRNDAGKTVLFELDSGSNPNDRTTFLGITAVGGNPLPGAYEIDDWYNLPIEIINGNTLANTIAGDTNADNFADAPYDVSMALGRGFTLNPGESTTYTTYTIFGDGVPLTFPLNIAPVAANDTATTTVNTAVTINVLANDSDADGGSPSLNSVTNPTNGTVAINNNGTPSNLTDDFVTYTPNTGFSGTDSFTYQISDGQGGTGTGVASVTVELPPQPTVNITALDATAAETGGDTGTYRISRNSSSGSLSVGFALSGNATPSDYTLSNNISVSGSTATVVFADGQSFVDVVLNPVNDTIAELEETLTLSLNANAAYILGSNTSATVTIAASDQITGTAGNDRLIATPNNDIIFGLDGNDNIAAMEGNDLVFGGNGNDIIDGDEGNDTLYGGAGNDRVEGSDGNDLIFGDAGIDTITGDRGNDTIRGGLNNDFLTGGTGSDIFVLAVGEGTDVISDFRVGQSDKIGLAGGLTFNDLSFSGNQISAGSQILATLSEINTASLTAANFIFV